MIARLGMNSHFGAVHSTLERSKAKTCARMVPDAPFLALFQAVPDFVWPSLLRVLLGRGCTHG